MSAHDHDDDPVENNDNERIRSALSVLRNTRREEDDSRNTTTATNVQGSNPNPMPGTSSDSIAAPSAPTTSSSGSVFVLSQSLDINTVDFNFSQTVPTVSRAPDHQGERGTHHEEHPVVINQAVVTPAENIIDGRSQENEESVDEEGVELMSLMNNSRRIIQASELQRRVNVERQRIMNKEKKQLFRVPGETSTASDTQSSEGEALIDPLHCRMKKKQVVDQIIPSIKLPFLSYSSTSREAALSSTDCTESEPEVVPGSGVVKEDRRPRMVPQVKPGHHIKLVTEKFDEVTTLARRDITRDVTPPLPSDHNTVSSQNNSINTVQGPAQLPHPPVTSTPEEVNLNTTISITDSNHTPIGLMLPSNHPPPIKYSSTDISTGSSSSSYIMKCKGVTRLDGENMEKADVPVACSSVSALTTPIDNNQQQRNGDVIQAPPILTDSSIETQDIPAPSQNELFPGSQRSQIDGSKNSIPQWMEDDQQTQSLEEQRVTPSSSDSSSQESHMAHLKRTRNPITSDSSSSSSSEKTTWISMSKRQRISGTPISPDVIEPPDWMKQRLKALHHSTPSGNGRDTPITNSTNSSLLPPSTDTSPGISPGSLVSSSVDSITRSLSSGYMGSISSGGGSSGFTPPQTGDPSLVSSLSWSKSNLSQVKVSDESSRSDNTNNNNDSEQSSCDRGKCDSSSDTGDDKRGGGASGVAVATGSPNCDADESAVASSNNNTPPSIEENSNKDNDSQVDINVPCTNQDINENVVPMEVDKENCINKPTVEPLSKEQDSNLILLDGPIVESNEDNTVVGSNRVIDDGSSVSNEFDCTQSSFALRLTPSQSQHNSSNPRSPLKPSQSDTESTCPMELTTSAPNDVIDLTQATKQSQEDIPSLEAPSLEAPTSPMSPIHPLISHPIVQDTIDLTSPQITHNPSPSVIPTTTTALVTTPSSSQNYTPPILEVSGPPDSHATPSGPRPPVYESVQYSSVDDTPPLPRQPPVVQLSNTPLSPDTNQSLSSGTPFQFHLPVSNKPATPLIRATPPLITPPTLLSSVPTSQPSPSSNIVGVTPAEQHTTPIIDEGASSEDKSSVVDSQSTEKSSDNEPTIKKRKVVDSPVKVDSVNGREVTHSTPGVTPFVLGDMREGQEGVNLDDSQSYEMPAITGMEESEQESASTFTFSVIRPIVSRPVSTQQVQHQAGNANQSLEISEDPFEFDSSLDESFVMPLRRKRKGGPYKSKPPQTATPLTTPHSTPVTDAPSPMATPLQIATPPTTATPVSFSSPSAFVQPQAMESLCSSHPNARYVRLNHVTTITTVRQYVSTEIVDRSTGSVVHSGFTEMPCNAPSGHKVSFEAEPLYTLPVSATQSPNTSAPSVGGYASCGSHLGSVPFNISYSSVTPLTPASQPSPPVSRPSSSSSPRTPTVCSSSKKKPNIPSGSKPVEPTCINYTPGLMVVARWKDRRWYVARVVKRVGRKVLVVYLDGDRENVSSQHILPLTQLPRGTQVIAEGDEEDITSDQSGSFLDHCPQSCTFRIETLSGDIVSCPLKNLIISAESAELAMRVTESSSGKKPIFIFSGYVFLLTEQKDRSSNDAIKRQVVEDWIKSHGGVIMNDYKPTRVLEKRTFCLSNTYCRTQKYFIALAVNLPCVKYEWVKDCVTKNQFISHEQYLLPAGVSTLSKEIIPWTPRSRQYLKITLFIHGDKSFKEFWERVCIAGGANILSKPPLKPRVSDGKVFIITDSTSSVPLSWKSLTGFVNLLSSNWLKESIMRGRVLDIEQFKL